MEVLSARSGVCNVMCTKWEILTPGAATEFDVEKAESPPPSQPWAFFRLPYRVRARRQSSMMMIYLFARPPIQRREVEEMQMMSMKKSRGFDRQGRSSYGSSHCIHPMIAYTRWFSFSSQFAFHKRSWWYLGGTRGTGIIIVEENKNKRIKTGAVIGQCQIDCTISVRNPFQGLVSKFGPNSI